MSGQDVGADVVQVQVRLALLEQGLKTHQVDTAKQFVEVNGKLDKAIGLLEDFTTLLNGAKSIQWIVAAVGALLVWFTGMGDWVLRHWPK